MSTVLNLLKKILKEIEQDNPFGLVLKGGTPLSLYYLNEHRESEDLDFDVDKKLIIKHEDINKFFIKILDKLKSKGIIMNYKFGKTGFASTDRYHSKLILTTYKKIYTKLDLDFIDLPDNLWKKGQLNLYSAERLFISKIITFIQRKEFKDAYDVYYLIEKIDVTKFTPDTTVKTLNDFIFAIKSENLLDLYKFAFRNADLKFRNIKENQLNLFAKQLERKIRILINKLSK